MSGEVRQPVDPAVLERALRDAFEVALPDLVKDAMRRLEAESGGGGGPRARPNGTRRADPHALERLIAIAHDKGREGVLAALEGEPDLVAIALSLHPVLGQKVRRWRDLERTRHTIADEIMKRAHRYDVFREPSGG